MEELKPLKDVLMPDERLGYFGWTLDRLHVFSSALTLNSAVPEPVQNQFMIARNAVVYSWYVYSFLPVAMLYGILAVEHALTEKAKVLRPKMLSQEREPTLHPLMVAAIQDRWIVDGGFDVEVPENIDLPESASHNFSRIPHDQRYCCRLLDSMTSLRNHLAHGVYIGAMPNILPLLQRDAELINQLYPATKC